MLTGFCLVIALGSTIVDPAFGQPPGTLPPSDMLGVGQSTANGTEATQSAESAGQPGNGDSREVNPKAFLFLDEAGNPVIVPGMTFEKLDELLSLKEGNERPKPLYTIETVEVRGRVAETSAELTVTVRIDLEPTGGRWVTVPMRMDNFHRTGPAEVSGIDSYRVDLGGAQEGHVVHLTSDIRRSVVVSMQVVSRVTPAPSTSIDFRLPEAPSHVELEIPSADVSATILGRGDEVLATDPGQNATAVTVDGGGGKFSVRFGAQLPVIDDRPVLESESRIMVDWQQADNSPIVAHEISVRSGRGDLSAFSLRLPDTAPLLQQPVVRGGTPFEVADPLDSDRVTAATDDDAGGRVIRVVPVGDRGDSRTEIAVATQLRSEEGRPGGRVIIRPVAVDDAIEQSGEIEIRVPREYRLRWEPRPWVNSLWDQTDADALTGRSYRFRFDRVPFELPVWLSARAKRLRVEGDYRLTFYDTLASLRLLLKTSGGVPDSRILPIDIGTWNLQSLAVGGTNLPADADQTGSLLEIDLASLPNGGENDQIEIVLVSPLGEDQDRVEFDMPRVAGDPELIGGAASSLTVSAQADFRFIADLTASQGIGENLRVQPPSAADAAPSSADTSETTASSIASPLAGLGGGRRGESAYESRYALPDISQSPRLAGFLVTERPGVSLAAEAHFSIQQGRLVESIEWTVYPRSGLRGRLPVVWGETPIEAAADPSDAEGDEAERNTEAATLDGDPIHQLGAIPFWTVTVDDAAAILRANADGEYSIFSDGLSVGPHKIRFRRERDLPSAWGDATRSDRTYRLAGCILPRPDVGELTLRGAMLVRFSGQSAVELSARDSQGRWTDELILATLPPAELPLRLRRVDQELDQAVVRRAVLRTSVSRQRQSDQLVATVYGGETLRLPLSPAAMAARVVATVDGQDAEVLREDDDACSVQLGTAGNHVVVLQLYADREAAMGIEQIRPLLGLPTVTERFFWEVLTPRDDHLIWSSPTTAQAMQWLFDRWRLYRQPRQSTADLTEWAGGGGESRLPLGNRYLFVGIDPTDLRVITMSRLMIWLIVGSTVLVVSSLLSYFPVLRHPLLAVVGAILLAGMTSLLPDAAVLAGQVMLVAMTMVAVMAAVGYLLAPRRPARVLTTGGDSLERSSVRSSAYSGSAAVALEAPTHGSTEAR